MALDHHIAAEIARRYFNLPSPPDPLGWGIGGYVYLSPQPGRVVKVHNHEEGYARELEVYRRLQRLRMTRLHGLTIPRLSSNRDDLRVIEMDFVSAPYLLDFAGVRFSPPDFSDDAMQKWHADIEAVYGPNSSIIYAVYHSLSQHGMYYMDFRVSNVKLDGLSGLQPYDSPGINDAPW